MFFIGLPGKICVKNWSNFINSIPRGPANLSSSYDHCDRSRFPRNSLISAGDEMQLGGSFKSQGEGMG